MRSRKYFWFFAISTVGIGLVRINIKGLLSLVQYMYVYQVIQIKYLRVKKIKCLICLLFFPSSLMPCHHEDPLLNQSK